MKRIKNKIIHWLGGYTEQELVIQNMNVRYNSYFFAYSCIKHFMDDLNGTHAEEWCKQSYDFVVEQKSHMKERLAAYEE